MNRILINSEVRETSARDVAALITELGLVNGTVLVEHNGTALRPSEWTGHLLSDGDRIELLRVAAGG